MKKLLDIDYGSGIVDFGIGEGDDISDFIQLRQKIYTEHGYFKNKRNIDIDEYDNASTIYIVARLNNKIIGGVRLIRSEYLPTEKDCFSFSEPIEMSSIPRSNRAELGRLVVSRIKSKEAPRNLIMLGLFKAALIVAECEHIKGGYAFIKMSLYKKMRFIGIPFHEIKDYSLKYNKEELKDYFSDQENPVVPIYYLTLEFKQYITKIFQKRILFVKIGTESYRLRNSIIWKIFRGVR